MVVYLPNEIWLEIFSIAIAWRPDRFTHDFIPFQPVPIEVDASGDLELRASLVAVCKQWRQLTVELLYRDVRIGWAQDQLKEALLGSTPHYGNLVRRVVLPYPSTTTGFWRPDSIVPVQILHLCSGVEVLVRPRYIQHFKLLRFEFEVDCLPLPALRRVEWWPHHEAERTGGINSLTEVLRNSPNVKYLFIGGVNIAHTPGLQSSTLCVPSLVTLRLFGMNIMLARHIMTHWSMPALAQLIIDRPLTHHSIAYIWNTIGPQLKAIEFGKHLGFFTDDFITPCLMACPNLHSLHYYIMFSAVPLGLPMEHGALSCVRLHFYPNGVFVGNGNAIHVSHHIQVYQKETFPNLTNVHLVGMEGRDAGLEACMLVAEDVLRNARHDVNISIE